MTPASPPRALILCHEIWGITPALQAKATTWRRRGFQVVVPGFYETVGLPVQAPDEGAAFRARAALSLPSISTSMSTAVDQLRTAQGPEVCICVVGYSMGGSIALWAATTDLPLAACVTYYGGGLEVSPWPDLDPGLTLLEQVRIPWLGLYGGRDSLTPPAGLAKASAICESLGSRAKMHIYPDLDHAFALDAADARYCSSAAGESESLTLVHLEGAEHLDQNLGPVG